MTKSKKYRKEIEGHRRREEEKRMGKEAEGGMGGKDMTKKKEKEIEDRQTGLQVEREKAEQSRVEGRQ